MKANSIEEFFGTMLESSVQAHKEHLKTSKYSAHKALNEFYDDAPECVDSIIEAYDGVYGKVEPGKNVLEASGDPVKYFEELKSFVEESRDEFIKEEDTEIRSEIDSFLTLIDQTLYKLKELKENMNNSLYESMGNLKSLNSYLAEKCCGGKKCDEDDKKDACPKCGKNPCVCDDKDKKDDKKDIILDEADVKDEKSFREYAMAVLKKMHGDDFDEKKAKETIDGMIADKKDDEDWGILVGKLQKS